LLKNIEFYILDKEKIYQLIKEETERMHLTFQPYNKGANFAFLISNGEQDVYGSIHSNEMSKDIYQGISKISYDFYNSNGKKNFIILVDKKENHFLVIPFNVMKNDFFPRQSDDYVHYDFNILRYPYRLQKSKIDLTKYQNNLDIIFQELTSKKVTPEDTIELTKQQQLEIPLDEKQVFVFVTGYNFENLEKSKKDHILGWTKGSNFLSKDSLVFVFDKTNLFLNSCFRVISKSDNNELIWADEIKSGKLIYPNRWKAELIQDSLRIPLSDINGIAPFDKEPFQGLLRGNFPMPLNSPQNKDKYERFRKFILDKLINYWIFIVSDQPKLKISAEEIYQTRMKDKFWGLNEHTPFRKRLKKGDLVIFCHGAKKFLGTAKLETNCFEPSDEQKIEFSHDNDFYKPNFGVMLSGVDIWQKPKEVSEYVQHLSFISNLQQYPVYFQGGIKNIRPSDYHLIIDDKLISKEDTITSEESELFDDQALPIPSKEQLHNAYLQIREKLLIDEDTIRNIVSNLVAGKHVLLSGPIGTGKTHLATMISKLVWNEIGGGYYAEMFTATSAWTTQDVIGGIYPKMEDKEVTYAIQKGCVSDTVSRNWKQHGPLKRRCKYTDHEGHVFKGVWLVIDEFNRANIDGAFGEMITALEHGNLKIPTSIKEKPFEELPIPKDYRIIGTLNTFDKHFLFKLSDALKRRFAYIEMLPPVRKAEEEKYYVLKRSSENLDQILGLQEKISLIETEKERKIDRDETDQDILRLLDSAYDMFSFIRQTKNLGTAILISIFRYVLVDSMLNDAFGNSNQNINDDEKKLERWKKLENSLDNAFISNIIPQLEGRSKWSLQCILSFCCEQIAVLLQNRNVEQTDFGKYKEEFKKLIRFLGRGNIDEKLDKFQKKQISEEEWSNYDPWKGKQKKPSLPKFRIAINELINESEIF
jgi:MoxR-like ATPase